MKTNKVVKIILSIIMGLFMLYGSISLSYNLYRLTGIENYYRYLTIAFLIFLSLVLLNGMRYSIKKNKGIRYAVTTITSLTFGVVFSVLSFYVNEIYTRIDNMNKTTYEYSTTLITFNKKNKDLETLNNGKIAIIKNEFDIEGYILAKELINENNIKSELATYDEPEDLINALYNKRVDAALVSSDYVGMYKTSEEYSDIEDKAIELYKITKTYTEEEVKEIESKSEDYVDDTKSDKSMTEPFTILLLGVDSTASKLNKNAAFNGDTIMLISFNPKTMSATMFSVPRDTYVRITCAGNKYKKINSAAYGGSKCMINTLEQWTGINIDYYVKINFKGVVDLVNSLGGIDVNVPMEFCEQNSKRQFGKKLICLKPGMQHLDGEQALALARHRKTLLLGDFQRGQNQQLVVEGMMNSIKNLRSANDVISVLDSISANVDMNIKTKQILSLYDVAKSMMFNKGTNMLNIQKTFLRGYDMTVYVGGLNLYTFHNWQGSLDEIITAMKENLGEVKPKAVKELHFSGNTEYERYIAGDRQFAEPRRQRIPNFTGYSLTKAKAWLTENNISMESSTISCKSSKYNSKYGEGIVVGQTIHEKTLALNVSSIKLYVNGYCDSTDLPEEITPEENEPSTNNDEENSLA